MSRLDDLLRPIPEKLRDKPFKLLSEGPAVVVELFGGREPDRSRLHRWESRGRHGVRLRVVTKPGEGRVCTRRWIFEFSVAVDDARRAAAEQEPAAKSPTKKSKARGYPRTARPKKNGQAACDDTSQTTTKSTGGRREG